MTYLDHDISGADPTTAATPSGVRDYVQSYLGVSGFDYWTVSDGSTSSNIDKNDTITFSQGGTVTTTLTSGDSSNTLAIYGTPYTAGNGLGLSSYEFSVPNGTTSVTGIVRLQDSATNGTVDRAITPNAVYDLSGVLAADIAATGATNAAGIATNAANIAATGATNAAAIAAKENYSKWILRGDSSTTTDINSGETVQFAGAGGTTIALGGTDNRVVTITSTDNNTTYTDGTGLQLVGTEFNVSGIETAWLEGTITNSQLAGSIANGKLANDSVTVTAGSGLSNGGEVDLGASITLDITPGGVTNAMLAGSISESKLASDVTLDAVTDNGATTTNNITVGTTTTSGIISPLVSGSGAASVTFDLSTASTFTYSIDETTTLALSNVTAGQKFMIRLKQDSTGSRAVNWFDTIYWAEGITAPTLTTTACYVDTFGFLCTTSGHYDGFIIGQNVSGVC